MGGLLQRIEALSVLVPSASTWLMEEQTNVTTLKFAAKLLTMLIRRTVWDVTRASIHKKSMPIAVRLLFLPTEWIHAMVTMVDVVWRKSPTAASVVPTTTDAFQQEATAKCIAMRRHLWIPRRLHQRQH